MQIKRILNIGGTAGKHFGRTGECNLHTSMKAVRHRMAENRLAGAFRQFLPRFGMCETSHPIDGTDI